MREADYQKKLKEKIKKRFPDCYIYKTPSQQIQGSPDLLILFGDKWAALEVKVSAKASHQPMQDRRVQQMNEMSFAAFVYPENEEEVLHDLEGLFAP